MRFAPNVLDTIDNDTAWKIRIEASMWSQSPEVTTWISNQACPQYRSEGFTKILSYAYAQGAANGTKKYSVFPKWCYTIKLWFEMLVVRFKDNWKINHPDGF